jgi:fibronectin-binding autotransporter adhesin
VLTINSNLVAGGALTLDNRNTTAGSGLTLTGSVSLAGNPLTVVGGGANTTLSGIISGTGGLRVDSAGGTVTLSGANTYAGSTTVNSGVLSVGTLANGGVASPIGASSNDAASLIIDGGTLQIRRIFGNFGLHAISTDRLFTLGINGGTIDAEVAVLNYAGSSIPLVSFSNPGAIVLTGTDTARTLTLQAGRIPPSRPSTGILASVLGDNGTGKTSLLKTGVGNWLLQGANTYTGTTTVLGGQLITSSLGNGGQASGIGASANDATNLIVDGGTLYYNGTAATSSDRLFTLGTAGGGIAANGPLSLTNTGAIALAGTDTARTLALQSSNSTGSSSLLAATLGDNGTGKTSLTHNGAWTLTGLNTYTGSTTLSGGMLSVITLANGGVASGIGASTNDAANLVFGGGLQYLGSGASTDRLFTLSGGGTIDSSGTGTLNLTNPGIIAFAFPNQSNEFILQGSNSGDNTFAPTLADNHDSGGAVVATSLTKSGSGTWVVAGANTYTGGTNVYGGILRLDADHALGNGSVNINATSVGVPATLDLNGHNATIGALTFGGNGAAVGAVNTFATGAATVTISGGFFDSRIFYDAANNPGGATISGHLDLGSSQRWFQIDDSTGTNAELTITAAISHGGIQMQGNGTLVLASASNTFTDGLVVNGGTVRVTGSLDAANTAEIANNGRLELANGSQTLNGLRGYNVSNTVSLEGGEALTINSSGSFDYQGSIIGNGSFTNAGTGTQMLSGTSTYTGGTTISGGTLQIGDNGTNGSVAGNITDNASLAFYRSNDLTYAGVISGSGDVAKYGAGTLTLTGANTYLGNTYVNEGMLRVGDGGTTGSIHGDVILNSAILAFNRSDPVTYAGIISGTGNVVLSGGGAVTLSGGSTYGGDTTVQSGTLRINGSIASSGMTTVWSGSTLGGSGSVGALTLNSGSFLAPGNSPGVLTAGNTLWSGGATYLWQINSAAGVAGTNWDLLHVNGSLALGASGANPLHLALTSLTPGGAAGALTDFNPAQNASFLIASTTAGVTGFSADAFAVDTTNFANPFTGSWAVTLDGNNLDLTYTAAAVPEPSTYAILAGLAALGLVLRRRWPGHAHSR